MDAFMKQNTKEWIQYASAITLIVSAIALAFLSFGLTFTIGAGVLTYIGEALASALGIFGIGVYLSNQLRDFKVDVWNEVKGIEKQCKDKKEENK